MRRLNLYFKRIIDVVGSGFGIITIFPLLVVIAALVKLTSHGPVFFKQNRIGKNGKTFHILKYRTMLINAESIGDRLQVKSNGDKRITKIGRVLRTTSLDELPQLLNVFVGQMSLVGPRPPVTYFPYDGYENYPEWTKKRFQMRPGITGLAQVSVRNSVPWANRIILDNQYIDTFNIWLDIKILVRTLLRVIKPQNIYRVDSYQHVHGEAK